MTDWNALREHFPALKDRVYLNTAGGGPMSREATEAVQTYFEEFYTQGDTRWNDWLERVEETRARLAHFLHASSDEIAFLGNASFGLNAVADLLADSNDTHVVTLADEFPSVTLPWLARGHRVSFLDTPEAIEDVSADLLALSFVQYKTGYRLDLAKVSALCREKNIRLVIDATQGFGVFPIDLEETPVDALVFSGYKWANAGYGIAPLYVSRHVLEARALPSAGWRSAKVPYDLEATKLDLTSEARGLELGHPPFAGVFALAGALELIESVGIDAIAARVHELVDALHAGLDARGITIDSPRDRNQRSSITMIRVSEPEATRSALEAKNILVSARGHGLRVSVHYYNTEDEIEQLLQALG